MNCIYVRGQVFWGPGLPQVSHANTHPNHLPVSHADSGSSLHPSIPRPPTRCPTSLRTHPSSLLDVHRRPHDRTPPSLHTLTHTSPTLQPPGNAAAVGRRAMSLWSPLCHVLGGWASYASGCKQRSAWARGPHLLAEWCSRAGQMSGLITEQSDAESE